MQCRIHIPMRLLVAADRRAKELKVSRSHLIVRALERELTPSAQWSPGFFAKLVSPEPGIEATVDEMLKAIRKHRRSRQVRKSPFEPF